MNLRMYQIDAFTDRVFAGNPAAVCPLAGNRLTDEAMQNIAMENNLAETAFCMEEDGRLRIRWFTPETEIDLCGHATLASAYALFELEGYPADTVSFESRSGTLTVRKDGGFLTMNFPTDTLRRVEPTDALRTAFDSEPVEFYRGRSDYLLVYKTAREIRGLRPNLERIRTLDARGVIVTAPGEDIDFVSRFFAPQVGIAEDPVTGSAHTTLTPYWSRRLGKDELSAAQLSKRGGSIRCRASGERTEISGQARLYLTGTIEI